MASTLLKYIERSDNIMWYGKEELQYESQTVLQYNIVDMIKQATNKKTNTKMYETPL